MEEKLGEDRSDSFVAMRLEKLKIKDPINSFIRCPLFLCDPIYLDTIRLGTLMIKYPHSFLKNGV